MGDLWGTNQANERTGGERVRGGGKWGGGGETWIKDCGIQGQYPNHLTMLPPFFLQYDAATLTCEQALRGTLAAGLESPGELARRLRRL